MPPDPAVQTEVAVIDGHLLSSAIDRSVWSFLSLSPHLFAAAVDDAVVLLDTLQDRYSLLEGPPATRLARLMAVPAPAHAGFPIILPAIIVRALHEVGQSVAREASMERWSVPTEAWSDDVGTTTDGRVRLSCAGDLLRARAQIALLPLHRILLAVRRRARQPGRSAIEDTSGLATVLAAHRRQRALVPIERRCLIDCLALVHGLARRSLRVDWMFGVRLQPFEAHCWLESGGLLLTDEVDIVRQFRPILRVPA